jgi:hypothetical protein
LRAAKQKTHAAIDPLWKDGKYRRNEVYAKLAILMKIKTAHIGEFDEIQCEAAIRLGGNVQLWGA